MGRSDQLTKHIALVEPVCGNDWYWSVSRVWISLETQRTCHSKVWLAVFHLESVLRFNSYEGSYAGRLSILNAYVAVSRSREELDERHKIVNMHEPLVITDISTCRPFNQSFLGCNVRLLGGCVLGTGMILELVLRAWRLSRLMHLTSAMLLHMGYCYKSTVSVRAF